MATYVFDGTANVSVANFNPATDTLIVDGVKIADVESFSRTSTDVAIVLSSGISVTLSGADFDALTNTNFLPAGTSDIEFAIGDGNPDTLSGNLGSGGFGADALAFISDNAIIYGNQQNDTISGLTAYENLSLYGGAGYDRIDGFGAGSVVYGGLGGDNISASSGVTEGVTVYGGNGSSDSMDGGDHIDGGAGNDLIYGNAGDDTLHSYGGDDLIFGGLGGDLIEDAYGTVGNDTMYGNLGDDSIFSGGGSDLVFGGQGDDSIVAFNDFGSAGDKVLLSGGLGSDSIDASGSVSENITIFGGNGASDTSDGGDTIYGSGQGDLIYGNAGNDSIIGNDGDDSIFGGLGADSIDGGNGINAVTGGAGADTFAARGYTATEDYTVVSDFTKGDDLIDVSSTLPTSVVKIGSTGATEYDTLVQVVTDFGTVLAGTAAAVTITNGDLAGLTFVMADTNGDGSIDDVIALTGFSGTITAADFV